MAKYSLLLLTLIFLNFCMLVHQSQAIIHHISDAVDWSSVDLKNFQYFKNLPSQNPKTAGQANLFLEHFQKKKAVLDYFENLFLGNSPFTHESEIPFDPHFGRAWRPYYVRKYGWKGERLIDALGKGYRKQQVRQYVEKSKQHGAIYYPN